MRMKLLLSSGLLAVGLGLATAPSQAAPAGGLPAAVDLGAARTPVETVTFGYGHRHCHWHYGHRHCWYGRRHWHGKWHHGYGGWHRYGCYGHRCPGRYHYGHYGRWWH
ncbi:MAG TPA: hypothetical protein VJ740_04510 [Hyphomicrobiaceae bacterium]|nr:hypothetical protein [Hyphomicrobiaceae bacterium]